MKKLILAVTFILMASAMPVMSQTTPKKSKRDLNKNVIKMARKAAHKRKKEGYFVAPGALPMANQLQKAFIKENMEDKKGYPIYIVASGNSVAETQSAAKIQALEVARYVVAGNISTRFASITNMEVVNKQLTRNEAVTIQKTVGAAKSTFVQNLGEYIPLVEVYKNVGKDNVEADVEIAFDRKIAMDNAKEIVRSKLAKEAEELLKKIDQKHLLDIK